LLATRGLDSGKHSGVIALFNLHFVKTGIVKPAIGRALVRSFEKRQASDYADFAHVSEEDARRGGEEAEEFVAACRAVLAAQGQDPSSSAAHARASERFDTPETARGPAAE
jgi:uncharacterized protein (UPF0332 family)